MGSIILRLLIPSWRFFDRAGEVPVLHYRVDQGEWVPYARRARRGWGALFLNAEGNLVTACHALAQRIAHELDTVSEESVTYRLLRNLVVFELRREHATFEYQFKIVQGTDDILISPVYREGSS